MEVENSPNTVNSIEEIFNDLREDNIEKFLRKIEYNLKHFFMVFNPLEGKHINKSHEILILEFSHQFEKQKYHLFLYLAEHPETPERVHILNKIEKIISCLKKIAQSCKFTIFPIFSPTIFETTVDKEVNSALKSTKKPILYIWKFIENNSNNKQQTEQILESVETLERISNKLCGFLGNPFKKKTNDLINNKLKKIKDCLIEIIRKFKIFHHFPILPNPQVLNGSEEYLNQDEELFLHLHNENIDTFLSKINHIIILFQCRLANLNQVDQVLPFVNIFETSKYNLYMFLAENPDTSNKELIQNHIEVISTCIDKTVEKYSTFSVYPSFSPDIFRKPDDGLVKLFKITDNLVRKFDDLYLLGPSLTNEEKKSLFDFMNNCEVKIHLLNLNKNPFNPYINEDINKRLKKIEKCLELFLSKYHFLIENSSQEPSIEDANCHSISIESELKDTSTKSDTNFGVLPEIFNKISTDALIGPTSEEFPSEGVYEDFNQIPYIDESLDENSQVDWYNTGFPHDQPSFNGSNTAFVSCNELYQECLECEDTHPNNFFINDLENLNRMDSTGITQRGERSEWEGNSSVFDDNFGEPIDFNSMPDDPDSHIDMDSSGGQGMGVTLQHDSQFFKCNHTSNGTIEAKGLFSEKLFKESYINVTEEIWEKILQNKVQGTKRPDWQFFSDLIAGTQEFGPMGINISRCKPLRPIRQKGSPYFYLEAYCLKNHWRSESCELKQNRCKVAFRCIIKDNPFEKRVFPIKMKVQQYGQHCHNNTFCARRNLSGELRDEIKKLLEHKTPQRVDLGSDYVTPRGTGDFTRNPTPATLRKAKQEARASQLLDSKPSRDLEKFALENEKVVRESNSNPYKVIFFSDAQIKMVKPDEENFHMDSTGGVCANVDGKAIHLYSGVIRGWAVGTPP